MSYRRLRAGTGTLAGLSGGALVVRSCWFSLQSRSSIRINQRQLFVYVVYFAQPGDGGTTGGDPAGEHGGFVGYGLCAVPWCRGLPVDDELAGGGVVLAAELSEEGEGHLCPPDVSGGANEALALDLL